MTPRVLTGACTLLATVALTGCTNPDAPAGVPGQGAAGSTQGPQSAGEHTAPGAPSPASQTPASPSARPEQALSAFALRYVNWSYDTLEGEQQALAGMSVGAARLAERQAAAASQADAAIREGEIRNSGRVVSIARDLERPGVWVIVTREQTAGASRYEGLPAALHVTLARLAAVPGGYAVSEWLPQT